MITSVSLMQRTALRWRREGRQVGFVPTMGYLHAGHMSLVHRARRSAGREGVVAVSIYVNPTQFGPSEDLSAYPRDFERDRRLCKEAGVDVIFLPNDREMYAGRENGNYSTYVIEEQLSRSMEGASRPTHFRGVTTVVAKLFNLVLPDVAVFGAKDYQQAAIIQRMTKDLNFPLKIIVAPTLREQDGLAMSSRNKYLDASQRQQAIVLWQAIQQAQARVRGGKTVPAGKLRDELKSNIETQPAARLDYIEFFHPSTLAAVEQVKSGTQMALAVFVGKTRLIDNALL